MSVGTKKLTFYLRPDQWLSLHAIALENAIDGGRPDTSQILRDIIDVYLDGRNQKPTKPAKKKTGTRKPQS